MRIVVLHDAVGADARADESDVLVQAAAVTDALQSLGHVAVQLGITLDLADASMQLKSLRPDLVFNLVESLCGHGRLIHVPPSLLDVLGVPYTGAPAEAQFITSNKLLAKRMLRDADVRTAAWHTLESLKSSDAVAPGRYILKSVWEHASLGLDEDSIIEVDGSLESAVQLREAINERLPDLGGEGFAEAYIDGREFNLALLADSTAEVQVLPPAEIVFDGYGPEKVKVVGYRAKWDEASFEYHHTPRRYDFPSTDAALIERLRSIAVDCWNLFGLRGHARVDFRIDPQGRSWVLEVNTNPCLSPDAGFAAALERAGISFRSAVERVIADVPATRRVSNGMPLCAATR